MKLIDFSPLLAAISISLTSLVVGRPIADHSVANLVVGQADFTSSLSPFPPDASSLREPYAVVVDPLTHKVFVADLGNHRVLRYGSADALAGGAAAEAVLGKTGFTDGTYTSPSPSNMRAPAGLCIDGGGRLWVADSENHRVLMFESASAANSGAAATRVYGQLTFTTRVAATSTVGMRFPSAVCVDAQDRMWVADANNHRVLRFDSISTKPNGAAADGVLGQPDFISLTFNTGVARFDYPTGIAVSSAGTLFVADSGNHRVLRFDLAASLGNGASASAALGQQNLTTNGSGISASQMSEPSGLALAPDDSLWVCDTGNNRVIRFDAASSQLSGTAATGVIGQPNFNTKAERTTAQGLKSPRYSPFVDATGSLWVSDRANHRILRFSATPFPKLTLTFSKNTGPSGQDQVTLHATNGAASQLLTLEASTDLIDWKFTQNVNLSSTGTLELTINQPENTPKQFFRLRD